MIFVLSDESVNNYGFRVLSAGIDLTDFKRNPIMLWNHDRDLLPIGKWVNIQLNDGKLTAEPELYTGSDPLINKIRGLLDQGIINATSISFSAVETSSDTKLMLPGQTKDTVTRSVLLEVSLVDIPANRNAVKVDNLNLKGSIFSLSHQPGQPFFVTQKISNMDLHDDLKTALSLSSDATDIDVLTCVKKMQQELDALKSDKITKLVEQALNDMRITAPQKEFFLNAAKTDYEGTKKHLSSLQPFKSIEIKIKEHQADGAKLNGKDRSRWTLTDWRKHDPEGLRSDPQLYQRLLGESNKD